MSIFKCEGCGCAENSALCRYNTTRYNDEPNLCSECDPKIGKWHSCFPKKKYQEEVNQVTNKGGN